MVTLKSTVIAVIIFGFCLTSFFLLFSLENKQNPFKSLHLQNFNNQDPTTFKLFDINFKYLINNNVCESSFDKIKAVIIVTSYYGNVETRSAMRRAFSNEDLLKMKLRRVFLLAFASRENKFDINYKAILHENQRFGDLVQGNFKEAYKNLTYKHIMGLKWASTYCKNAKYIIKMDDDIVINMHKLINLLNNVTFDNKDQLAGYIFRGMVPIREPANKWYVTKQEYSNTMYPPFLSGWFYITSPKTAEKLVHMSQQTNYFWIDDVYVTGILAKKLKIKQYNLSKIFAVHSEYLQCCIRDLNLHNYECDFLIGPNGGDTNMFVTFNNAMFKCATQKCLPKPDNYNINNTCVAERKILIGKGKALIETVQLF